MRTPVGRYGGALAASARTISPRPCSGSRRAPPLEPALVEDVILGCANQAGEDNRNVARMSALLAGLPVEIAGQTVNRLCGSGLQAINSAAHAIMAGDGDVFVAGGVESMTRAPYVMAKAEAAYERGPREMYDTTLGWRFTNPKLAEQYYPYSMGETGENVAEQWGVSREEQDAFALVATSAPSRNRGRPLRRPDRARRGAAAQGRAGRRRSRRTPSRRHHAGGPREAAAGVPRRRLRNGRQRSGINDGASAVVVVEADRARELGLQPMARVVSTAVAGVDPSVMGLGPIPATRKALERAGIGVDDLDLIELNEAFARQSLGHARELGLDPEKVNVNGGAIALGHPLGMSGARLITMLSHELAGPAGATAWRRCASASGRGSPRSSSASMARCGVRGRC